MNKSKFFVAVGKSIANKTSYPQTNLKIKHYTFKEYSILPKLCNNDSSFMASHLSIKPEDVKYLIKACEIEPKKNYANYQKSQQQYEM